MIKKGCKKGGIDKTLFIRYFDTSIIIAQIYVDDIVFGSTSPSIVQEFVNQMREEFEMSMVGELNFFLGLLVKQSEIGIFISQSKYAKKKKKKKKKKTLVKKV